MRRSEVFAGRVDEDKTLEPMLKALHAADALVVMDAGIATEDNVAWLRDNGYRYLVVSRQRTRRFDPEQSTAIRPGRTTRFICTRWWMRTEARCGCTVIPRSAPKRRKGSPDASPSASRASCESSTRGCRGPAPARGSTLSGSASGGSGSAAAAPGNYTVDVVADPHSGKAVAVTWKLKPLAGTMLTHPGVYCLRSNVHDWDPQTLWRTYTMLTDLEAVFRSLKSELGLRPIFHKTQNRSDGHLFITVIAYQLVQTIRRRLAEHGENASWTTLRRILQGQHRVTASFRRKDGRTLHVRKATRAEQPQLKIYTALDLHPAPGGVTKLIA